MTKKPFPEDKAAELLACAEPYALNKDWVVVDLKDLQRIMHWQAIADDYKEKAFEAFEGYIYPDGPAVLFNKAVLQRNADLLKKYYTREVHDGYHVLEAEKIPAPRENAVAFVRKEPVYEWFAEPGDVINFNPGTPDARQEIAQGGERIFVKRLKNQQGAAPALKVYTPAIDKRPLTEEELGDRYAPPTPCELKEDDPVLSVIPEGRAFGIRLPHRDKAVPMLEGALTKKTMIRNARAGKPQRFEPGDALKYEDNQWVGVRAEEIAEAWEPQITRAGGVAR